MLLLNSTQSRSAASPVLLSCTHLSSLHNSLSPSVAKLKFLRRGKAPPSSTAWLFFNSASLTNTAFPNYNSTRKLYSFIKKKINTQIQTLQKFSPSKNKQTHTQTRQSKQAGVLCPRHPCSWRLCGAGQGGWPLRPMASLYVLKILALEGCCVDEEIRQDVDALWDTANVI